MPAAEKRTTYALIEHVHSYGAKMRPLFASVRARTDQPGMHWKLPWITAATAVAFVAIVIAVKEVAVTTGDRAASGRSEASAAAPVATDRGVSASTAQAPRAEPVMPHADTAPTQPPARHRSLCSAANEAAGLCNPQ